MNKKFKQNNIIIFFIALSTASINAVHKNNTSGNNETEKLSQYTELNFEYLLNNSLKENSFYNNLRADGKKRVVKNFPKILAQNYSKELNKELFFDDQVPHTVKAVQSEDKQALIKQYQLFEITVQKIKHDPTVSFFGGINYGMNVDEMQKIIQNKLQEFKNQKLIITDDEFKNIKNQYYTDHSHTSWSRKDIKKDLSRVWIALYLKEKINQDSQLKKKYAIPDFIIVANDPKKITVRIWGNQLFPVPGFLENAKIYFKNIKGINSGCNSTVRKEIGENSTIGYIDLCDGTKKCPPGLCYNYRQDQNVILCHTTNKYYIIDTEPASIAEPGVNKDHVHSILYGHQKFCYIHNVDFKPYKNYAPQSLKEIDEKNRLFGKTSLSVNIKLQ